MNNNEEKKRSHSEEFSLDAEGFPARDANDSSILMHRDVHFGGDFGIMLDYYLKNGRGVLPEFEIRQIEALAIIEKQMEQNLAGLYLSGAEAEKVADAKNEYKRLRKLYENDGLEARIPQLIADLILTEDEDAKEETDALLKEKEKVVPALIKILRSEEYYDPLFPGYGQTPMLAAKCLGLIGTKQAIVALFDMMREGDFFQEEIVLEALQRIGEPAKEFLLTMLERHAVGSNQDRAAVAIVAFRDDPKVGQVCLKLLQDPKIRKQTFIATYLVLACEGLTSPSDREKFRALAEDPATPKSLKLDIQVISKSWK